jgi:Tubulin-tyrosine ligase family
LQKHQNKKALKAINSTPVQGEGGVTPQKDKVPAVLFICKPEASSQGKGIFIFKRVEEMRQVLNS